MMQLEILEFKFENTKKCVVDIAENGFEAFENVIKKFNADH